MPFVVGLRIRRIAPGSGPNEKANLVTDFCPFPGLRFFDVDQSGLFFGREADVEWLVKELDPTSQGIASNRFLAIVGPSGSGKSSLVRAGVKVKLVAWSGRNFPFDTDTD